MLVSPFFSSSPVRLPILLATLFTLFLFGNTTNISAFNFFSPLSITARMRYLIPLAGLLLLPYADVLSQSLTKIWQRFSFFSVSRLLAVLTIILLAGSFWISTAHQSLLSSREAVRQQIISQIPDESLVIGSSDDCIYFLNGVFQNRDYLRVDDLSRLFPSFLDSRSTPVYILDLQYSNRSDSPDRQAVIDQERAQLNAFLAQHANSISLIYETASPHALTIYQYIPPTG